jgi:hypothetical protein
MFKDEPNLKSASRASTWFWVGLAAAVAAGGLAFSFVQKAQAKKPLPKAKALTPERAAALAVKELGADAHPYMLTDFAYSAAYPQCPAVIDPTNPEHDVCRGYWLDMLIKIRDIAGVDPETPIEEPDPAKSTGIAAGIAAFLAKLTESQRAELRTILGAQRYDNIVSASQAGNDGSVRAQVVTMRKEVEKLMKTSPLQAYSLYSQLQKLLGDAKLEEFLGIIA